jgi:hypothetical protein
LAPKQSVWNHVFVARTQHRGPQGHRRYFVVVGVVHFLGPRWEIASVEISLHLIFVFDLIVLAAAGSVRGFAQVVVGHPLDTIKGSPLRLRLLVVIRWSRSSPARVGAVRLQTQGGERSFNGLLDCFWKTLTKEGVLPARSLLYHFMRLIARVRAGAMVLLVVVVACAAPALAAGARAVQGSCVAPHRLRLLFGHSVPLLWAGARDLPDLSSSL